MSRQTNCRNLTYILVKYPWNMNVVQSLEFVWNHICLNSASEQMFFSSGDWLLVIEKLSNTVEFIFMMMSWHGNIFHITGPLWGGSQVTRGFSWPRGSKAKLWCLLCCWPQQAVEQQLSCKLHVLKSPWCSCDIIVMNYQILSNLFSSLTKGPQVHGTTSPRLHI